MNNKSIGFYLTIVAAVLCLVGALLYGGVTYKMTVVYGLLIAAAALGVLAVVAAVLLKNSRFLGVLPIVNSVLIASAAVWGVLLMVNEIAYVISALNPFAAIQGFVVFEVVVGVALLLNLVASFLPQEK